MLKWILKLFGRQPEKETISVAREVPCMTAGEALQHIRLAAVLAADRIRELKRIRNQPGQAAWRADRQMNGELRNLQLLATCLYCCLSNRRGRQHSSKQPDVISCLLTGSLPDGRKPTWQWRITTRWPEYYAAMQQCCQLTAGPAEQ